MGTLVSESGARTTLFGRTVVGRAPSCELQVRDPRVSALHATIWWDGEAWRVRDLGSRNGTWLDGRRLEGGQEEALGSGARLAFGDEVLAWTIADLDPPGVVATPIEGGAARCGTDLVGLPDDDEPAATVYRSEGAWWLDGADGTFELTDGDVVLAGSERWRIRLPPAEPGLETAPADNAPITLDRVALHFDVSLDEEHVRVALHTPAGVVDLGSRAHHFVLLLLARARLGDRTPGLPVTAEGWVYQDDAAAGLGLPESQLNLHVFRARKQLAAAGIEDPGGVVERRSATRQLRIGVAELVVRSV